MWFHSAPASGGMPSSFGTLPPSGRLGFRAIEFVGKVAERIWPQNRNRLILSVVALDTEEVPTASPRPERSFSLLPAIVSCRPAAAIRYLAKYTSALLIISVAFWVALKPWENVQLNKLI